VSPNRFTNPSIFSTISRGFGGSGGAIGAVEMDGVASGWAAFAVVGRLVAGRLAGVFRAGAAVFASAASAGFAVVRLTGARFAPVVADFAVAERVAAGLAPAPAVGFAVDEAAGLPVVDLVEALGVREGRGAEGASGSGSTPQPYQAVTPINGVFIRRS